MISLGGTIGTGLFLASGASVANAGPGGALIAYGMIGIMVFFMMECLGEMVIVNEGKQERTIRGNTPAYTQTFSFLLIGYFSSYFR